MRRQQRKKTILAAFAIILCMSVSLGAAAAYFSDYEDAAGGAVLNLGGGTEMTEGSDSDSKHIVVQNVGETNMITRVAILDNEHMTLSFENESDWIVSKASGEEYSYYYYSKVLKPGEKTSAIDAELAVEWKGEEPEYSFDVTVIHESAQAVYNGKQLAAPDGWDQSAVSKIAVPPVANGEGE